MKEQGLRVQFLLLDSFAISRFSAIMAAMSLLSTPPDESVVVTRRGSAPRTGESAPSDTARHTLFPAGMAILYAGFVLLGVSALNPYFAQTWDVGTFIQAAHRFLDGGNPFDLYAQSRAAQTWPFAYPPLHALVTAISLAIGSGLGLLPEYVWARVPTVAADIGVALLLYVVVERKTRERQQAQIAALLWLFNPVTFYDTAVQGHFESEWLLFVLLAYAWFQDSRRVLLPAVALAIAFLSKQVAILFALPVWFALLLGPNPNPSAPGGEARPGGRPLSILPAQARTLAARGLPLVAAVLVFGLVVLIVCLPYLRYSNDFLYMNLTYVENVPVQTQSWIVALLGLTRAPGDGLVSDFILLRYQTLVTLLAAAAIAFFGARRRWSLYLTATLIVIAFFLTSKKVMGYYYVMLLPFLLLECLPARRSILISVALVATTWISLSPYYAGWGDPEHWWIYALLGIGNSIFFIWLFVRLLNPPSSSTSPNTRQVLFVSLGLFAGALLAALLQPLVRSSSSPIRAPIVASGMEATVIFAFALMIAGLVLALALITRSIAGVKGTLGRGAWVLVLIFSPLFFAVLTLTKESTAIFEIALKAWGG